MNVNSRENTSNNPALLIVTTNNPFTVSITSPIDGTIAAAPTNITINASASDTDGTVTQIQFFVGTKLVGISTNAPFSAVWSNAPVGLHALTVVARDNGGLMATSSVVNVTINNNLLPVADAHVRDGSYTNTNFGSNTILEEENNNLGNNRDAYLKFGLSNISTNISSAILQVFAGLSGGGTPEFDLYAVTDTNWVK